MMAVAFAVDPRAPTLSRWLDHFDHAVAVMGIRHVGLGADLVDQLPPLEEGPDAEAAVAAKARHGLKGFARPDDYRALIAALRGHGHDGERLDAIMSGNWLRVLRATLPA
jgi:microsomal dipeptidase-like Zn-dependent dipeptidase